MAKPTFSSRLPTTSPNDNLIDPFVPFRYDICPHCNAQRIELLSFNGYPQHYRDAVDALLGGRIVDFNQYEIHAMRCRACGKEFVIDWNYGFPKPLTSNFRTARFIDEFCNVDSIAD